MSVNEKMTELANAVRDLTGDTDPLSIDGMISGLQGLHTAPTIYTASGEAVVLDDCATRKLYGLNLYGKTTQDGTPTPEAPVELVSAGADGTITVTINGETGLQTLTALTPNGLPGLPVDSDGNYTDANGQQWICDEVDFANGVYIQRVLQVVFDGSDDEGWGNNITSTSGVYRAGTAAYCDVIAPASANNAKADCKCSHYAVVVAATAGTYGCNEGFSIATTGAIYVFDADYSDGAIESWKAFLAENPMTCLFLLATPVETALTAEEIAEYAALYTTYPSCQIYNDCGVYMAVSYAADEATAADYEAALAELGVEV